MALQGLVNCPAKNTEVLGNVINFQAASKPDCPTARLAASFLDNNLLASKEDSFFSFVDYRTNRRRLAKTGFVAPPARLTATNAYINTFRQGPIFANTTTVKHKDVKAANFSPSQGLINTKLGRQAATVLGLV